MKVNTVKAAIAAALLGAALLPLAAQADSINQRLSDQHGRIHQGVGSEQLTRREQYRLNRRDASIHRQEHRDRQLNDGHLTAGERRGLTRELNRSSRTIYRDKHNTYTR